MAWFPTKLTSRLGLSPGTLLYVGESSPSASRVTLTQYQETAWESQTFRNWEEAQAKLKPGFLKWVHVEGLYDVKLVAEVGRYFKIHQMTLEDILNTNHRPKLTDLDDYLQIIFRNVSVDPKTLLSIDDQAALILGKDFVISFSEKPSQLMEPLFERIKAPESRMRILGVSYMAFAVLDLALDHFTAVLDRLGEAVDRLETQILKRPSEVVLGNLYELRIETAYLLKVAKPIRELAHRLAEGVEPWTTAENEIYFRDLDDHATQIVENCEAIRETLSGILQVSDSANTHKMNTMLRFFTIVSAIFIPLNFLASVYGMNFSEMPWLRDPLGFYVLVGIMGCVALFVIGYFRFRRWW